MPEMTIPRKLLPLVTKKKRFKVAFGGRGSGKSMTIADILLMRAQTEGVKIGCFREFMNSIDDSVHAMLASEIDRLKIAGFTVFNNAIRHKNGAEFKFKGLARNPEGIKSAHDFGIFFVEEAQTISYASLRNLTPTLRTEGSELWFAANPRSMADPFYQRFIKPFEKELRRDGYYEDDLHLIIWVNYHDNPFFPEVLEQERQFDKANRPDAEYRHIWDGETLDEVSDSIIPTKWFDAAIDAHLKLGFKPSGAIVAAYDPSDEGADSKGFAVRHGSVVLDVCEKIDGDVATGTDWALELACKHRADWFVWDCDGMGISLKRQVDSFLSGRKIDYFMFRGSESPENPGAVYDDGGGTRSKSNGDTFRNRRAQYYWRLRDAFYATYRAVEQGEYINPDEMISLSSSIVALDQLRSEVCRIPRKYNSSGKIQIMSKQEMAKKPYELPSPNMSDALMMSWYHPRTKAATVDIEFEGW